MAQPEFRPKPFKIVTRPKPTKSELSPDKPSQFMLCLSMTAEIIISNRALPSSWSNTEMQKYLIDHYRDKFSYFNITFLTVFCLYQT